MLLGLYMAWATEKDGNQGVRVPPAGQVPPPVSSVLAWSPPPPGQDAGWLLLAGCQAPNEMDCSSPTVQGAERGGRGSRSQSLGLLG